MSRRDTIIVAVLVNAALLMILFATAVRSTDAEPSSKKAPLELAKQFQPKATEDDILNQYVTPIPTLAETASNEIFQDELPLAFPLPEKSSSEEEKIISTTPSYAVKQQKEEASHDIHYVNVTVKKGDFLEKIAKTNNTSVSAIVKANNLSSTQLKVGQLLRIPLAESKVRAEKSTASPPSSVVQETDYYVVKEGDNPWLIASRHHLKLDELLRLNHLDEQKAKKLRPGDRLKIR